MDVRYETLEDDIASGVFKARLAIELTAGFRILHEAGERLPPASHYAARIAEIVGKGAEEPLSADLAFHAYQEILAACEEARAKVLGEVVLPS